MTLFATENREQNASTKRVFATYELAHTLIDFGAAVMFIIGSIMFFYETLQTLGTWFFLIGSIMFAAKPALRLSREARMIRLGDYSDVADKLND